MANYLVEVLLDDVAYTVEQLSPGYDVDVLVGSSVAVDDASDISIIFSDYAEGGIGLPVPSPDHDWTISKIGSGTYEAVSRTGTVIDASDVVSPVSSGLKSVLDAVAVNNVSIFFPAGVYEFPEDPAGEQDHWAPNGIHHMTLEGSGYGTIISNWRDDTQVGYDTNKDTEPFSMTRCHDLVWKDMRVWAGGNIDLNNSSDCLDFDGCSRIHIEGIYMERSRARGVPFDGGDDGADSSLSRIVNCRVRGVPAKPALYKGTTHTIVSQEYRYIVTYVDTIFGETMHSEIGKITPVGTSAVRISVSTGPNYKGTKGVTARKIYRWSTAQPVWKLLVTLNDNTTEEYDDFLSDAAISSNPGPPITGQCLIPSEGIKLLGSNQHTVTGNIVSGTGGHGISIVRKGSDVLSKQCSGHKVIGNTIRYSGHGTTTGSTAGIYVGGGSGNIISENTIVNAGTPSALGLGIYIQGLGGEETAYNILSSNHIKDDQDINSPCGGRTTRYGIQLNVVAGGNAPDNTTLIGNTFKGMQTGDINNISSTNTKQFALSDHTHPAPPGGAAPITPNWHSGLYYGSRTVLAHTSIAGQALAANQAFASPIYVPADITVTTIACNVATAAAGTKLRMGIYTNNGTGRPGTLVAGSETADITATAGLKAATISAALTGGLWYWMVLACEGVPSVTGFSGGQPNIVGSIDPSSGTKLSAYRTALGAGWSALPSTFAASPTETAITLNVEVTF